MTEPGNIDSSYKMYRAQPTPENLATVVKHLEPTIRYAVAQTGSSEDPYVQGKARLFAAHAVEKYNPDLAGGANLPTHVSWQLKQLTRAARSSRSPVKIPERIQLDSMRINHGIKSFTDKTGREPDTLELADHIAMSPKRIEKVRRQQFAIPSEQAFGSDQAADSPDFENEAVDYVFHDSDHTDRKILEMKTGYGGHPVMSPGEIAMKLKLTPVQLTRRSIHLTRRINELTSSLGAV